MTDRVTGMDLLLRTALLVVLDGLLLALLVWRITRPRFRSLRWPLVASAALCWGTFAVVMLNLTWEMYYQHFYTPLSRTLAPLAGLFYAVVALGMWWLARKLALNPVAGFFLLAGVEGVLEHLFGIYVLDILSVPILADMSPAAILVFAFFEYILYWGAVLGLAALVSVAVDRLRSGSGRPRAA